MVSSVVYSKHLTNLYIFLVIFSIYIVKLKWNFNPLLFCFFIVLYILPFDIRALHPYIKSILYPIPIPIPYTYTLHLPCTCHPTPAMPTLPLCSSCPHCPGRKLLGVLGDRGCHGAWWPCLPVPPCRAHSLTLPLHQPPLLYSGAAPHRSAEEVAVAVISTRWTAARTPASPEQLLTTHPPRPASLGRGSRRANSNDRCQTSTSSQTTGSMQPAGQERNTQH